MPEASLTTGNVGVLTLKDEDQPAVFRRPMIDEAGSEDAIPVICHQEGFVRVVRARGRRYWQSA